MKKSLFAVLMLALGMLSVNSCAKDEGDDKNNTTKPVACIQTDGNNINGGDTVQFTSCSTNATSYLWDFGDGYTAAIQNPKHVFADGGPYTTTLTASNGAGSDTATTTITCVGPSRNDFLGTYSASESCSTTGSLTYTFSISASSSDPNGIIITGFGGYNITVSGTVDGYNFTVPEQIPSGGFSISGSGTISNSLLTLTFTYTASDGTDTDFCNSTATKL